jgi:type VI secretion system secreted protein Hcp
MAFDAFLFVADAGVAPAIAGETQDPDFKGAFEITEFSFGAENTLNITSATGGAGAGKATFKEFTVKKQTDSASGQLLQLLGSGGHYKIVKLFIRKSGGAPGGGASKAKSGAPYLVFAFGMVALKSLEWSGSSGDDVPTETVVFEYGELKVGYYKQKTEGTLGGVHPGAWSKLNNSTDCKLLIGDDVSNKVPIQAAGGK